MSQSSRPMGASQLPEDHQRSNEMFARIRREGWELSERDHQKYVKIAGRDHHILDGTVTEIGQEPLISVGAHKSLDREIIVLNPASTYLKEKYQELKEEIIRRRSSSAHVGTIDEIFEWVMNFVRKNLNSNSTQSQQMVQDVEIFSKDAKHKTSHNGSTVIELDEFIKKGVGVCRHHALFNFYLIHELIKDHILPEGKVYHHRDDVLDGGHVWCVYKPELQPQSGKQIFYLVDSLWSTHAYNVLDRPFTLMEKGYGQAALAHCISRYSQPDSSRIPFDIERVSYGSIVALNDDSLRKDFLHVLFSASETRSREILIFQLGLGAASFQRLRDDLAINQKYLERYGKTTYTAVLRDVDYVLKITESYTQQHAGQMSASACRSIISKMKEAPRDNLITLIDLIKEIIEGQKLKVAEPSRFYTPGKTLKLAYGESIQVPHSAKAIYDRIAVQKSTLGISTASLEEYQKTMTDICQIATTAANKSSSTRDKETTQKFLDLIKNHSNNPALLIEKLREVFKIDLQEAPRLG